MSDCTVRASEKQADINMTASEPRIHTNRPTCGKERKGTETDKEKPGDRALTLVYVDFNDLVCHFATKISTIRRYANLRSFWAHIYCSGASGNTSTAASLQLFVPMYLSPIFTSLIIQALRTLSSLLSMTYPPYRCLDARHIYYCN